jgi:HAE1 family hydrophobic/amphiphilic exporter-1
LKSSHLENHVEKGILKAAQQYAKPIVMTSMCMLQWELGFGAGNAFREPVTVIICLIASRVLSLLFVPLVYVLINDFERSTTLKLRGLITLVR